MLSGSSTYSAARQRQLHRSLQPGDLGSRWAIRLQSLDDTMRRDALIPLQNRGAARTEMEIRSRTLADSPDTRAGKEVPNLRLNRKQFIHQQCQRSPPG